MGNIAENHSEDSGNRRPAVRTADSQDLLPPSPKRRRFESPTTSTPSSPPIKVDPNEPISSSPPPLTQQNEPAEILSPKPPFSSPPASHNVSPRCSSPPHNQYATSLLLPGHEFLDTKGQCPIFPPDGYNHFKVIEKLPGLYTNYKLPSWVTDISKRKNPRRTRLSLPIFFTPPSFKTFY